eukprot:6161905-Prymnesium_polylepis.2
MTRGVNSQKYNQKSKITPSEAPSKTISESDRRRTSDFATPRRTGNPLLRKSTWRRSTVAPIAM